MRLIYLNRRLLRYGKISNIVANLIRRYVMSRVYLINKLI